MEVLNEFLKTKGIYSLVMILFFLGVYGMVLSKNYMKKLMAMNVMQVAVIYFYLCFAQKDGAMIPIQMVSPLILLHILTRFLMA